MFNQSPYSGLLATEEFNLKNTTLRIKLDSGSKVSHNDRTFANLTGKRSRTLVK
jgi:hypothetical protein